MSAAYATRVVVIYDQRQCKTQKTKSPNFLNTPDLCSSVRNVGEKKHGASFYPFMLLSCHVSVSWHVLSFAALCVFVGSLVCFAPSCIREFAIVCVCVCVCLVKRQGLARRRCAERAVGG